MILFPGALIETTENMANLQVTEDEEINILEDTFIAFARVFSGTLKRGIYYQKTVSNIKITSFIYYSLYFRTRSLCTRSKV